MAVAQKLHCRVEALVDHGEHVYTVALRPDRPAPRFRPGQFLHLALDEYDPSGFWPESRVFSIASSPAQRDLLRISYSVRGRFTARMERELAAGRTVWIKLPYGEFVVEDARDVVLFAGGTGITAFTAFLEGLTPDFQHEVCLAYGARSRELLIYRERVEQQRQWMPRLKAVYFVEREDSLAVGASDVMGGRLNVADVWSRLRNPLGADYYISGPPVMLKTISESLKAAGVNAGAIRIDAWE